jgi:ParB family chromosome partitioning protein
MSKASIEFVVKMVAIATVLAAPDQTRQQVTDEQDIQLTESIKQHGVLQPIGIRPDGKLVWGHRRLRCSILAGRDHIPAVILNKDMTEGEYLVLQMLENVQRADLCHYDLWQGCLRLLAANPGWQLKDLAKNLSLDPATVTKIMSASKACPEVVSALQAGKIGFSHVYAITKGETPEEQLRLLSLSLAGTSHADVVKEAKRNRATPAEQTVKLSRVKCPLSTGIVVTVAGPDMSLDTYIDTLQSAIEAAKKCQREKLDIKTAERVWRDRAKVISAG